MLTGDGCVHINILEASPLDNPPNLGQVKIRHRPRPARIHDDVVRLEEQIGQRWRVIEEYNKRHVHVTHVTWTQLGDNCGSDLLWSCLALDNWPTSALIHFGVDASQMWSSVPVGWELPLPLRLSLLKRHGVPAVLLCAS